MVILENRSIGNGRCKLESLEQIVGSQTWVYEFPSGFGARCHYTNGQLSLEELNINVIGLVSEISRGGKISGNRQKDRMLIRELQSKFNEKICSGDSFSKEELETFLKDGFFGLLKMRCSELEQDEGFNFLAHLNDMIESIDIQFNGASIDEILAYIDEHLGDENSEEFKLWNTLKAHYEGGYSVDKRRKQIEQDLRIQEIKEELMDTCKGKTIEEVTEYFQLHYKDEDSYTQKYVLSNLYIDPIWARDIKQGRVQQEEQTVSNTQLIEEILGNLTFEQLEGYLQATQASNERKKEEVRKIELIKQIKQAQQEGLQLDTQIRDAKAQNRGE